MQLFTAVRRFPYEEQPGQSRSATDHQSFESVIERQNGAVFRLAFSYVKNRPDAEDVLQDVFLKYFQSPPDFTNRESERAWSLKVTANTVKSHLRRARAALSETLGGTR